MQTEPQPQHKWLDRLLGNWTYEMTASPGPGQPEHVSKGVDNVRSIEGMWVVAEGDGDMGGCMGKTIMTLGYDPAKGKYVGTFVGSMMPHLWIYEGEVDETGNRLVLESEGPDFVDPAKTCVYRDTIEFIDDNHRTLSSSLPGPDGAWQTFMTMHFKRQT